MKQGVIVIVICMLICLTLAGCASNGEPEKIRDLEYTVQLEEDVPNKLREEIAAKKEAPFKLTYSDDDDLYIVVGYGMQLTGGYSIQVKDLYLTKNIIYCDTTLIGPQTKKEMVKAASYPVIILKTENLQDISVVFE